MAKNMYLQYYDNLFQMVLTNTKNYCLLKVEVKRIEALEAHKLFGINRKGVSFF